MKMTTEERLAKTTKLMNFYRDLCLDICGRVTDHSDPRNKRVNPRGSYRECHSYEVAVEWGYVPDKEDNPTINQLLCLACKHREELKMEAGS